LEETPFGRNAIRLPKLHSAPCIKGFDLFSVKVEFVGDRAS
jgi:hypothetical protein